MKSILSLAAAFILIFSAFSAPVKAVVTFDDLFANDPFAPEIIYLHQEGIVSGYPDGTFRPNKPVSRADAMVMIGRALELDGTKRATPYKDVPASHPASGYIASAAAEGILLGYKDRTFRPGQFITRGDTAVILDRAFDFPEAPGAKYKDVKPGSYSFDAVSRASYQGVIRGYRDNTFRLHPRVTRAEFAAFLARAVEPSFIPDKHALLETANDILVDLKEKDFAAVSKYVSNQKGLTFCPYSGGCLNDGGVTFTKAQVQGFMESKKVYEWGHQDGSGFPIKLTPAGYYDEYLMNASYEEKERFGRTQQPMTRDQIRERFPTGQIVEFYYPGTEQYDHMDWQNLNMVFEKGSNGKWILVALVNNRWTI
ncbi:S-layer homology domain-containing protein [Planococcus sp. 1R117A]|uniref:S-layer homology domain-containing protein n=1 Tax=Planococcus sp. 1R117A TaxID=3447020 RepID=UPI003EDBAAED